MENAPEKGPLGLFMSISLVIGVMIGAGIFFLPSSLAPLGWNAVIGWVISGIGALCLATTFRFLMDGTGKGIQHNIERILGEVPGFLAVWAYWIAGFTSIAALSLMGGSIIADLSIAEASPYASVFISLALVWMLVAINLAGTRSAGRFLVVSVLVKLVPLVLVVGIAIWALTGSTELQPIAPSPVNFDNVSGAVALTLFALLGFETASVPVGKISNPGRNIPLALIGGTALVLILYIGASTGMVMVVPWEDIAASSSPFSDMLGVFFGPITGTAMALCILVSVLGCNNGLFLIGADCSYSMALRGELPRIFAHNNSRGVPDVGLLVQGVGVSLLIFATMSRGLSGMFTFMVLLTSGAVLILYLMSALSAVRANRRTSRWPVLAVGLLFIAYATYGSGAESVFWVAALLIVGLFVRWLCKRAVADAPKVAVTTEG